MLFRPIQYLFSLLIKAAELLGAFSQGLGVSFDFVAQAKKSPFLSFKFES